MSDYSTKLPIPHVLLGYNATIRTVCRAEDKQTEENSGVNSYIKVPADFSCRPLVTVQAYDLGGRENGPCWYFDYEADQERGVWVLYDETIHLVPTVSATLPDPEPVRPSLDMSASNSVEFKQSANAPKADAPPFDEIEDYQDIADDDVFDG